MPDAPTAERLTFGLRFKRTDAILLRSLADRCRLLEIQGDLSTYEQAAIAAELGEPLQVICENHDEILIMAALYVRLGLDQPEIVDLNSR